MERREQLLTHYSSLCTESPTWVTAQITDDILTLEARLIAKEKELASMTEMRDRAIIQGNATFNDMERKLIGMVQTQDKQIADLEWKLSWWTEKHRDDRRDSLMIEAATI